MKKKILFAGLMAMIIASPLTVFADTSDSGVRMHKHELTTEQKAEMETYRSHVDEYLNGTITLEQLKSYHDQLHTDGLGRNEANFESIMKLQKDYKDGKITKDEFTKKMDELRPERPDNRQNERGNKGHGNRTNDGSRNCLV